MPHAQVEEDADTHTGFVFNVHPTTGVTYVVLVGPGRPASQPASRAPS